jgi:hypothetical protein
MPRPPRSKPATSPDQEEEYQPPAPFSWEDRAVFRETFLVYFTPPDAVDLLRRVGAFFYGLMLESSGEWPDWPETQTRAELRGVVVDLLQMQGFLSEIWKEGELSAAPTEDLPLCKRALDWSRVVARVAREIEGALGPIPGEV